MIAAGLARIDRQEHVPGEVLRVDDRLTAVRGHVREDLEARPDAYVVSIAGQPVGHPPGTLARLLERLDPDELTDLGVAQNCHRFRDSHQAEAAGPGLPPDPPPAPAVLP